MPAAGFEFSTATRIIFGAGSAARAAGIVGELGGTRALVVTGRSPARALRLCAQLDAAGISVTPFAFTGEPTVDHARAGVALCREQACDVVIALGGGSALDGGKAIAGLCGNGGDPLDYLEVVGRGLPLTRPALPFVAMPTTAGTGAEVTRNAVLGDKNARVKASLRGAVLLPRVAIVDPDLLDGAPPAVLAASGMDALSQLIEPYLSAAANPLCDALAREGMQRSARSLRTACLVGLDAVRKEDLALASLFGGLALANAGLGAVHGLAAPLGGMFAAPHGAVCAALLPAVLEVNARALAARAPAHPSVERLREVAAIVTNNREATLAEGLAWLRALRSDLGIPGLAHYGLTESQAPALVAAAMNASSMKKNPVPLTEAELMEIVVASM